MADIYEDLCQKALAEFDEFDRNEAVNKSLDFALSNSGSSNDHESWSAGSERFANDNYDVLKRWLQ